MAAAAANSSNQYLAILSSANAAPNAAAAASASKKNQSTVSASSKAALQGTDAPLNAHSSFSKIDLSSFDGDKAASSSAASKRFNRVADDCAPNAETASTSKPNVAADNFGLEGLVSVIRSSTSPATSPASSAAPASSNAAAAASLFLLGADLSTLGLDLTSSDFLHAKFASPWFDTRTNLENLLPACYAVQMPPPATLFAKATLLSDETLFYAFYAMPRDKIQQLAACELYAREWRYHKGLKLWFTRDPTAAAAASSLFGASRSLGASNGGASSEKGVYLFFDFTNWEKVRKEFTIVYAQVEDKPAPVAADST